VVEAQSGWIEAIADIHHAVGVPQGVNILPSPDKGADGLLAGEYVRDDPFHSLARYFCRK